MVSKGFYVNPEKSISRDGTVDPAGLLPSKGEVVVSTDEGVDLHPPLRRVVFATGNELSAGSEKEQEKEKGKDEKGKDAKGAEGPRRADSCSSRPRSTPP